MSRSRNKKRQSNAEKLGMTDADLSKIPGTKAHARKHRLVPRGTATRLFRAMR